MKKNKSTIRKRSTKSKVFQDRKYAHLTYRDRSIIHEFLNYGYSFTAIGDRIHKDRTTVAKEIKLHRFVKPFKSNRDPSCDKLLKPPFVCNGCKQIGDCHKAKLLYDAAIADHEYKSTISLQRSHLMVTMDQIAAVNEIVAPLMIHKHHSVNHMYVSHPEALPFSKSTFYRYIDMGLLDVKNIDLQRKVRFRVKKEYDYSRDKIDHSYRLGRQYHDFQYYMEYMGPCHVVEMDTVVGTIGGKGGKALLSLFTVGVLNITILFRHSINLCHVSGSYNACWKRNNRYSEERGQHCDYSSNC